MDKKFKEIEGARSSGKEATGYQGRRCVPQHCNTLLNSGFLEQWMMEGKLTDDEAWMMASDLMSAGINTVRSILVPHSRVS